LNRFIALLLPVVSFSVFSTEMALLGWDDLRPTQTQTQNPIALPELSFQQRLALQEVFTLSQYDDPKAVADLAELKESLKADGLDTDALLKLRAEYIKSQQQMAETVVTEFDGQKVRIPGFLVPVEFSAPLVATEFLLVPVAGACIHMPPPPANQIVRVSYPEGYKVETVQYPVWVEGVISSKLETDNVYLVDGHTDVAMGYTMNASLVRDYH
jgi:hypothetical protein